MFCFVLLDDFLVFLLFFLSPRSNCFLKIGYSCILIFLICSLPPRLSSCPSPFPPPFPHSLPLAYFFPPFPCFTSYFPAYIFPYFLPSLPPLPHFSPCSITSSFSFLFIPLPLLLPHSSTSSFTLPLPPPLPPLPFLFLLFLLFLRKRRGQTRERE